MSSPTLTSEGTADDDDDDDDDALVHSAPAVYGEPWLDDAQLWDPMLRHAALGTACALRDLMLSLFEPRPAPKLLDESALSLCARGAPLASFDWGGAPELIAQVDVPPLVAVRCTRRALHAPRAKSECHVQVRGLVWFLVTRLSLNIAELVHAYMMFEACVAPAGGRKGTRPGLLGINYVRRLFFGCCSLVIKVNHDVSADSLCSNP